MSPGHVFRPTMRLLLPVHVSAAQVLNIAAMSTVRIKNEKTCIVALINEPRVASFENDVALWLVIDRGFGNAIKKVVSLCTRN